MSEYECWFCKEGIGEDDTRAVHIELSNLWFEGKKWPKQKIWGHSKCAQEHLSHGHKFNPDTLMKDS